MCQQVSNISSNQPSYQSPLTTTNILLLYPKYHNLWGLLWRLGFISLRCPKIIKLRINQILLRFINQVGIHSLRLQLLQLKFITQTLNYLNAIYTMAQAVKVMVRSRPMNTKQKERNCVDVVQVDFKNNQINLIKQDNRQPPKSFTFDCVFGPDSPQNLIYQQSAFSLVDSVLDGYNGTIFAYGQTGCGKTHTMMGVPDNQQLKGIIPRTFSQIITVTKNDVSKTHLIRCSFMQIYNQQVHDLLGKDIKAKMQLKQSPEKGVFVKDLTQIQVDTIVKMQKYMEMGFKNRATRATNMNAESSRSHSLFSIYIDSQEQDDKGDQKYKASKLNLVDLAGSQRASKTGTTGQGMKQATKINLSLSALGNVISALVDGKAHHIPYRDSKLTRLLQDSLGGNTKTIMIAALSPANYNYDQTLSTLRYASRAKFIQNKPKINQDPKDALLRQYMDEIKKLKMMLEGKVPIDMGVIQSRPADGYSTTVTQKIVYRDISNKQDNTVLQQQLKNKQNLLLQEQQQKRLLQQKLQNLQKVFSTENKEPDGQDKDQLQKIRKLKEKLKSQKKKEEEYQREKQKRQEQLLNIQKNYKNLNEQVDEVKQRFAQIKKKYIANLTELRDVQNQHQDHKQQLLDTIRYQEKQIKKFSAILSILMNSEQIDMIVNSSQWDQQKRQWKVPAFTYREKNVNLPKLLSKQMAKDFIETQKQKKQLHFRNSKRDNDAKGPQEQGFKLNNIVKNARQAHDVSSGSSSRTTNVVNRAQLIPLKSQSYEKARGSLNFVDDKKKRTTNQKLDPIEISTDSRKHL